MQTVQQQAKARYQQHVASKLALVHATTPVYAPRVHRARTTFDTKRGRVLGNTPPQRSKRVSIPGQATPQSLALRNP